MSEWGQHLDNPFALSGFAALLLCGLALQIVRAKGKLDFVRRSIVIIASLALIVIGFGGLVLAFQLGLQELNNVPADKIEVINEERVNSPSFGNVGGDVEIRYDD